MHRMRGLADGTVAFEIVDDDADGLRRQQRDPGEISPRQARIGAQHGQDDELRRRDAEVRDRAFQRQPRRGLGLAREVGEVTLLAALALTGRRGVDRLRVRDFRRNVSDVRQAFFARPFFGDYSVLRPVLFAADAILALPKVRSCACISVLL